MIESTLKINPSERVPGAHWIGSLVDRIVNTDEKFLYQPLLTPPITTLKRRHFVTLDRLSSYKESGYSYVSDS